MYRVAAFGAITFLGYKLYKTNQSLLDLKRKIGDQDAREQRVRAQLADVRNDLQNQIEELSQMAVLGQSTFYSAAQSGSRDPRSVDNVEWVNKALRIPEANQILGDRINTHIVIAQPDTGFMADVAELDGTITLYEPVVMSNAVEYRHHTAPQGEDRVGYKHGSSVASVILSHDIPDEPDLVGISPIETEIRAYKIGDNRWYKGFTPHPSALIWKDDVVRLTRAVKSAIDVRNPQGPCDVISMSVGFPDLGRLNSETLQLQDVFLEALRMGIICVAAAGNYTYGITIFPAALPSVIGMGACGYFDRISGEKPKEWKYSGYGDHVDFVAPGHDVWAVQWNDKSKLMELGQSDGTSYSTAFTAGLAALWLKQHGGRKAVQRFVEGKQGVVPGRVLTVQDLFVQSLKYSARQNRSLWNPKEKEDYGYGLIDASCLEPPLEKLFDSWSEQPKSSDAFLPYGARL